MSAAFTKGPWDFGWHQPSGDFTLHYGTDEHVGPSLLEGGLVLADDKENEANAHLIAAAPELYAMGEFLCERIRELEHSLTDDSSAARDYYGHVLPATARLEMTLARARGEQ